MAAGSKNITDMTKGNPWKLMLAFAIPLFIGNVFQMFYNIVDTMVVGRFVGAHALAAVGGAGSSYNLMLALITGFTGGGSVLLAQAFGSGDREEMRKSYGTSFLMILAAGLVFTFLGQLLGLPLLRVLRTPGDVIAESHLYLRWMYAGILATSLYNGMAAFLRAVGNSRTPLVALIAASVLNVLLDLLFVLVFHWDTAGVAAATVIAQAVSGIYCLLYVRKHIPALRLRIRDMRPDRAAAAETVRIGVPSAFSTAAVTISVMLIQRAVNGYGSSVMAAYVAANKTESICFCLSYAIGMATGVFCGQNKGAGDMDRVREGLFTGIKLSLLYHAAATLVLFAGGQRIVTVFTTDADVVAIGRGIVRITACFAPVLGLLFVFQHFLRSVSDVRPTIYMSFAEIFSRGVMPYVLSAAFGYYGIWWATPIGWCLSLMIGVLRYRSGKWKNYRT